MSKILFEDTYRQEDVKIEVNYFTKGSLAFASSIALLGALAFSFLGEPLLCITLAFVSIIGLLVIKLKSNVRLEKNEKTQVSGFGYSYMCVYDDKVVVKKPCKKEKVYNITPNQYTITLKNGGGRVKARDYQKDNIHLNDLGGKNMGKFVWSKLKDIPCWDAE